MEEARREGWKRTIVIRMGELERGERGEGVTPAVTERDWGGGRSAAGGGAEGSETHGLGEAGRHRAAAPAERKPRAPQRRRGAEAERHL